MAATHHVFWPTVLVHGSSSGGRSEGPTLIRLLDAKFPRYASKSLYFAFAAPSDSASRGASPGATGDEPLGSPLVLRSLLCQ